MADDKSQKQKFAEKAREIGCDDDEAAFESRLRKIVRPQTPQSKPRKKKAPAK